MLRAEVVRVSEGKGGEEVRDVGGDGRDEAKSAKIAFCVSEGGRRVGKSGFAVGDEREAV